MNLTIDQGNTSVKVALFDNGELVHLERVERLSSDVLDGVCAAFPTISGVIVSSVGDRSKLDLDALRSRFPSMLMLDHSTPVPVQNCYGTPHTLGMDRLASCIGANALSPNVPLLVVDMGTCITIDFVTPDGRFLGGNISPGMQMRFKALHQYTSALPLVAAPDSEPLIGSCTTDAIAAGVVNAITFEIEGYVARFKEKYPNLLVYLTGGDAFYFEKRLKNCIFANPNLLLIGLNRILTFNE
ncbi:MAG: type III pantothenate kinase [Paludibacteraceae bacterium]|nr:type III pantothenate kinase [Candidatus Physcocola equi]MCQ2235081.1 type III pantothenate kinase [Paludibacteraceae bacterium]